MKRLFSFFKRHFRLLNTSIYDGAKYEKNLNVIRAEPINGSGTQVAPEYLTVFLSLFNEGEL